MSLLKTNEIQNYNGSSLTLTASTVSTSAQLNTGGNISVTGSLNVSDDSTTRTNLGLGSMATQNANGVAITGGTINTVQPATGQSLTIKDEDGNTAIIIGTDNTAAGYLSLNFGSYHGDSGGAGGGSLSGNTLDDYEEGTFTPSFISDGVSAVTHATQQGYYTKVGRLVTVTINMFTDAVTVTNSSNNVRISGLPFTSADVTENVNSAVISETFRFNSSPPVSGRIQRNEAQIYLLSVAYTTAGDPTLFTAGGLTTGAGNKNTIRLTATYFVA